VEELDVGFRARCGNLSGLGQEAKLGAGLSEVLLVQT
jgi:hypothetical protein